MGPLLTFQGGNVIIPHTGYSCVVAGWLRQPVTSLFDSHVPVQPRQPVDRAGRGGSRRTPNDNVGIGESLTAVPVETFTAWDVPVSHCRSWWFPTARRSPTKDAGPCVPRWF